MSSPGKKEWKNPRDIMRVHRIKRQSSSGQVQTISRNLRINRRHSFTSVNQKAEDSGSDTALKLCISDTKLHSSESLQQKRRNPFGCDTSSSSKSKRRSVLDEDLRLENLPVQNGSHLTSSVPEDKAAGNCEEDFETDNTTEHKFLSVLNLKEQMEKSQSPSPYLYKEQNISQRKTAENILSPKDGLKQTDVLKEKSPNSNAAELGLNVESLSQNEVIYSHPPLDWSLKTKLRIVLQSSVDLFKKYPGIDAKHVDSFVHHQLDTDPGWDKLDLLQQIRRCSMHYSYPQMPWISLFPRLSSDFKSRSSSVIANSDEALESLQKNWSTTFTSVYQQLRNGLCPYFYVCTHQFTVLFRCLRSSDRTSWSAMLSPSTRGLREVLTKEGIDFKLPNVRLSQQGSTGKENSNQSDVKAETSDEKNPELSSSQGLQVSESEDGRKSSQIQVLGRENVGVADEKKQTDDKLNDSDEDDDDNDIGDDAGASRWLEGMGLDKKDFPTLDPHKVKLQREGYREIDNRLQSMVYVEGVDVHPFFNFLLNHSACIAVSGPQHGIPPTILSPVSFVGAALVQNNVKNATVTDRLEQVDPQTSKIGHSTHIIEVAGPILPHLALNIASVLQCSSQCESATMQYSTHSPSSAFNTYVKNLEEKDKLASGLSKILVDFSKANPGLLQNVKTQMTSTLMIDATACVKQLSISHSGFSWTC